MQVEIGHEQPIYPPPMQHLPFGAENPFGAEFDPFGAEFAPFGADSPFYLPLWCRSPLYLPLCGKSCMGRADINLIRPNPER